LFLRSSAELLGQRRSANDKLDAAMSATKMCASRTSPVLRSTPSRPRRCAGASPAAAGLPSCGTRHRSVCTGTHPAALHCPGPHSNCKVACLRLSSRATTDQSGSAPCGVPASHQVRNTAVGPARRLSLQGGWPCPTRAQTASACHVPSSSDDTLANQRVEHRLKAHRTFSRSWRMITLLIGIQSSKLFPAREMAQR